MRTHSSGSPQLKGRIERARWSALGFVVPALLEDRRPAVGLRIEIEHPADSHSCWNLTFQIPQGMQLEHVAHPDGPVEPAALGPHLAALIGKVINGHLGAAAPQLNDVAFRKACHRLRLRSHRQYILDQAQHQGEKHVGNANLSLFTSSSIQARAMATARLRASSTLANVSRSMNR